MKKTLCSILALLFTTVALLSCVSAVFAEGEKKIKVACVGDSITAGSGDINYPRYLQELLGDNYEVKNFGLGGAAVRYKAENDGSYFWYGSNQYLSSLEYDADVVFVMMGTNDVGNSVIAFSKYFKTDYYEYLVKPYLENGSEVVVMTSPCAYSYPMQDPKRINTTIREAQIELAEQYKLKLIDMNTATSNMRECFPDGLHGNTSGYNVIAQTVYKEYFGGEIAEVTVKTQPDALVTIGNIGIKANAETGEAVLNVLPKTHDFVIALDGYKSAYGKINVPSGKSKCEIGISSGGANVAKGAAVSVSSESSNFKAYMATDGDMDTRWQANGGGYQWMQLDMGKVSKIGGIRLHWEPAYGKGYKILVSADGSSFTQVSEVTDGDGAVDELYFDAVDARYIKLEFTAQGSAYGYSLYEVQALESDGSALSVQGLDVTPETVKTAPEIPWLMIGICGGAILLIAAAVAVILIIKKKKAV